MILKNIEKQSSNSIFFLSMFPPSFYHSDNIYMLTELIEKIVEVNEDDWTVPIIKNNIIIFFYTIFQKRYNEIIEKIFIENSIKEMNRGGITNDKN